MNRKGIGCFGMILCLLMTAWLCAAQPVCAASASKSKVTSESIKEKEKQIDQARDDMKELKGGLSDLQSLKKELEKEKSNLKNYVTKLDQNLAELEESILQLQGEIAVKEGEIQETARELEQAQETAQDQYAYIVEYVRFSYELTNASSIWELIFAGEGFGDLLNRLDYINKVYEYDQEVWEDYVLNCEYIELCKEQLEVEEELLEEQKANVEEEQTQVEALIDEKKKQITAYETDINNKEKAIKEYEAEIAEQNEIISQLEKQVEKDKEELKKQNARVPTYDGGVFKFPLATYTRISDEYGYRIHPTLGVRQFHNGVDFASPAGTAIYAAYDGVVVAASYSSTMGNYVMINHGDGLYTIYMHASKLYVQQDAAVKKGDTIAAVGTTGRSTGNHLHFGVRKDGVYVSPWNYLSQ